MRYDLIHVTRHRYAVPVSQCLNEVRLTPRSLPSQQVLESVLTVEPLPAFLHRRVDYFGNDVAVFGVLEKHAELTETSRSTVEVGNAVPEFGPGQTWEFAHGALAAQADDAALSASEFVNASPYVPALPELDAYTRETFGPGRPLLDAVKAFSARIHSDFRYDPAATSIDSPFADVFRDRCGVCQDFAHVMIGGLRGLRLAARYVSGYVRSGGEFQGAQASHAWVSVFFPGTGWIDFDPTNDCMPTDTHVTLAWGRDYGDVAPVKGVTLGGGGQSVAVEVYLRPL
jgi:transglutaminase-like putative cysteine protease